MSESVEVWKDIPGWEGYYQVSNLGNVKSLTRTCSDGATYQSVSLKPFATNSGYCYVDFCKEMKTQRFAVHRLVAISFLDNYSDELDVDHINNNKLDNTLNNIRMVTRQQNIMNRSGKHGSVSMFKGVSKTRNNNTNPWRMRITMNGRTTQKNCATEIEAAKAYDGKARELFGQYGRYNFPQEGERGVN